MSQRIHSLYLTPAEEEKVHELAQANGASVNFVIRVAVRQLLGLGAPVLSSGGSKPATSSD